MTKTRNPIYSTYWIFLAFIVFLLHNCTYTQKIQDGNMAFDRKQYSVAIPMLKKEYSKSKSRIEKGKLAYLIGESYRQTNQNESSIEWYQIAYDYQVGEKALKRYAFALKQNQQYKEAKEAFKNLGIEIGSPYEYRREITACTLAEEWMGEQKSKVYFTESTNFNTSNSDYAPSLYGANQLVFTSDRSNNLEDPTYNWTGNKFSDIYTVDLKSNDVQPFNTVINSVHNEGTLTFSPDRTELFFTRCFSEDKNGDNYCKLMRSEQDGETWTIPEVLNFVEEKVNYGHPALSADGNTLYFSCNHPDGWGGYDLYFSNRSPEGWDLPKLMNRSINSIGNERFPSIDKDTLYFSSDHHSGMGGLDIFKTYKVDKDNWSPVHNLKSPINSGADDFGMVVTSNSPKEEGLLQIGYFSSARKGGEGNDDIYRFEKRIPPPPPPIDTTVEVPPIVYKMILNGFVLEKIHKIADNPNSDVLGRKPLAGSKVSVDFGSEKKEFVVGEDGQFSFELEENQNYNFFASRENYLNNTAKFSTKGIGKDPENPILTFEIEIVLDKIYKDREITLDNIYYDFDASNIRTDAQPTLNKLTTVLEQNPTIKIELASHTDCQGNANYNENLSQRRAQSAVNYLIANGIDPIRLSARGYGESSLAIDCVCSRCSDEEHQVNRRTTFKIIE